MNTSVEQSNKRKLKSVACWIVAAFIVSSGCRTEITGTTLTDSNGSASAVDENLLESDLEDAGYGAALILDEPDGSAGTISFRAIVENGLSELRIVEWTTENAVVNFNSVKIGDDAGDITRLLRVKDSGNRYVATSRVLSGQASLILYEESGGGWQQILLDEQGDAGAFLDMKADSFGALHIAYVERSNGQLRYLVWQDGVMLQSPTVIDSGFEAGQVNPGGNIDFAVSLALTAADSPVISYYDATNGQQRVARLHAGTADWTIDVVGRKTKSHVLNIDSEGIAIIPDPFVPRKQQITIRKNVDEEILADDDYEILLEDNAIRIFNVEIGSEYQADYIVKLGADYGTWSTIKIGNDGTNYLSFHDFRKGNLVFAINTNPESSDEWIVETVDNVGIVGGYNDLSLFPLVDPDGVRRGEVPIISYQDITDGDLKLAYRQGNKWNTSRLVTAGITGFNPSLARAEDGRVFIAYREIDFNTFKSSIRILATLPTIP